MIQTFQDLNVWEKGHSPVLEIYKTTKLFPREEQFGLTAQVRRSATSVCANIAEGYKKSNKDFLRFIDIAQGSLEETKYHLILGRDLKYFDVQCFERLFNLYNDTGRMLNALSRSLRI
ncbi:MAG: four helix bundle protein [Candidatus Omnitrophica bacterium]|nr:four helix bundle protein [Candidatus Omnitrophota bacterium]